MKRARRIDPLYVVATILTIAVLGLAVLVGANAQGQRRTASVFDQTSGGASDLRALVEALGARTVILQGERFAPRGQLRPNPRVSKMLRFASVAVIGTVVPSKRVVCCCSSVCSVLCPRRPSDIVISLALKRRIVESLMPFSSGAST